MNKTVAATEINETFSHWIDSVVELTSSLVGQLASSPTVQLVEDENAEFVLHVNGKIDAPHFERIRIIEGKIERQTSETAIAALAGGRVELVLRSDRFLFQPLELPNRATEFMPGIVRSQIDRLTPWNPADAAFGWSQPTEVGAEKMIVTIAATPFASVRPYVQAIAEVGANSIAVFTASSEADSEKSLIKVWEQKGKGGRDARQVRRALVMVLAAASIAAAVSVGANAILSTILTAQQDELARQISASRSAVGMARTSAPAERALEQRKRDAPSTALILETLSKLLPDQTYVTELQVEGNKLRLTGVTQDAPSLIGLMEQSGHFARATFFAPTTRSPSDRGERFHVEAVIKPGPPS